MGSYFDDPAYKEAEARLVAVGQEALETARRATRDVRVTRRWDHDHPDGAQYVKEKEPSQPTLARIRDDRVETVKYRLQQLLRIDVIRYDGAILTARVREVYADALARLEKARDDLSDTVVDRVDAVIERLDAHLSAIEEADNAVAAAREAYKARDSERFKKDAKRGSKLQARADVIGLLLDVADNAGVEYDDEVANRVDYAAWAALAQRCVDAAPEEVREHLEVAAGEFRGKNPRKAWLALYEAENAWPAREPVTA